MRELSKLEIIAIITTLALGVMVAANASKLGLTPETVTQQIHYCAGGHHGVKMVVSENAGFAHSFLCNDGTTELDRGQTEEVPLSDPSFKHP